MGRINAIEAGVIIIFRWQSSVTWIITVPIISSISCRVLVNRKFSFFFSLLQGDFATHRQRVTDDSLHRPIFFVVDWTIFFSSNIFVLFFFFPLSAVLLNIKPSWKLRKAILVLFDGLTFCLYLLAKKNNNNVDIDVLTAIGLRDFPYIKDFLKRWKMVWRTIPSRRKQIPVYFLINVAHAYLLT